ncbi:MAG: MBL fold metallo-hydrolase [Ruminococcus sp.]|nr:MBL fold metallo-hydrolase [Ruminococcus sp.]
MKKILCIVLAITLLFLLCSCTLEELLGIPSPKDYNQIGDAKLIVHFIDVGQGDSTLLESKGEFVLIDAGERDYGDTVAEYAEKRGCNELKYMIATHPDSDHVGGLKTVIETIDTENFITCETDKSTSTWLNVLHAVDEYDVNYIDAEPGKTYSFGEATFTVLAPLGDSYNNYNNYSVVVKAQCGDISFLLTGDAEKESEEQMLRSGEDLSADVLKCGHHGSSTSTSDAFLSAVDPAFAVISCGKNNDYGHPHRETVSKLRERGVAYYRTDLLGTVVAATDGKEISVLSQGGRQIEAETFSRNDSENADQAAISYVGNRSSHVFHRYECSGVKTMKDENMIFFDTREKAIEKGFSPCSLCNP